MVPTCTLSRSQKFVSAAHLSSYKQNGYVIHEDVLGPKEVEALRQDTLAICRGKYGDISQCEAPKVDETDEALLERHLCIHMVHKASPTMCDFLAHPAIVDTLTGVIGPDVKCMQSMLFIKAHGMPGQAWHQDEHYIPTRDRSLTGVWIALDDATIDNGCMWVIPGSHQSGVIWPQHEHGDERFDSAGEAYGFPFDEEAAIPVEIRAGSVLFFNGYLLHRSLPNTRESGFRRALVHHYMSAQSLLPWVASAEGWAGDLDFRDIVMVAGTDPYAHKGITDIHRPSLRSAGIRGKKSAAKGM
jgi:ectoine hydroxylase-related dioxygenase (phytanoyl-CoA dioxygenase family)